MEDVSYGGNNNNQTPQRGRGAPRGRGGPRGRGAHPNVPRGGHRQGLKESSRVSQAPSRARGPLTRGFRARGTSRGGQFGRSTQRTDTDGDSTMGEDSNKWRRNKDSQAAPTSNWVVVQNFSEDTDVQELTNFLVTNSATPINVLQCFLDGNKAFIQTSDSQQSFALKKLSGIFFNKQKLFIKQTDRENRRAAMMEALVPLVMSRFDAEKKLLNLGNLAATPVPNLQIDFSNFNFVKSLLLAAAQKCPDVTSINFESNQVQSLTAFGQMARILHNVANLSFENNIIQNFEELDNLKDMKLREIMLAKNPIQTQNTETKYHNEISKRFKGIKYLDGQKIQPLIDFGVDVNNLTSVNLPPIRGNLFDTPQTQALVEGFVKKFLPLYDKDRNALLDAYTDTAFFSVAVNIPKAKHGNQPFPYGGKNRNMMQVVDMNKRMKMTNVGRVNIISFANTLPATQHIVDGTMKVDAFVQVVGNAQILQISLHGSFWEASGNSPTGFRRSYDRVFLLTPAAQDSSAAQQGWPAVILNDQLIVRNYVAPKQEANANNNVVLAVPIAAQQQLTQPQMVEKFVFVTSLKPQFAAQCLEQNQWNYDKAIEAFTIAKSNNQIPSDMFQ